MSQFNLKTDQSIEDIYSSGLLPQRNDKNVFYKDSSSRCDLSRFKLSSENRRILRKTEKYTYQEYSLNDFEYSPSIQKTIHSWIKELGWDFPTSSVKNVFKNHIFNKVIVWKNPDGEVIAYAVSLISDHISHIAYLFYSPTISHQDILIRIVLQFVIDSYEKGLTYTYLGRFSPTVGFYKRNMPGFEYYNNSIWQTHS